MVFVDGLGIAPEGSANPINRETCPILTELIRLHCHPIDASLGMRGTPQSATGQTSLLTGVNAAKAVGRHIEGFPGKALKDLIEEHGVFKTMLQQGIPATFANAYFIDESKQVANLRHQSVTTVATLAAFGDVRKKDLLLRNEAVYHDITRDALETRGYTGGSISIEDGAAHLLDIAASHAFTLFEFFETDRAGHSGRPERVLRVLKKLDEFVGHVVARTLKQDMLFILTSDHGNIEDGTSRTHSSNAVPLIATGPGSDQLLQATQSLTDVVPALLNSLHPIESSSPSAVCIES